MMYIFWLVRFGRKVNIMKKIKMLVIISIFILLLACHNPPEIAWSTKNEATVDGSITRPATEQICATIPVSTKARGVFIDYPVLSDASKKINLAIKTKSKEVPFSYYELSIDEESYPDELDLEINSTIKLNNRNFVSVTYSGYGKIEWAGNPNNFFYAITLSKHTNKELTFTDVVYVNPQLLMIVKNIAKTTLPSAILLPFLQNGNDESLSEQLKSNQCTFYLSQNVLGLSMPVVHAYGDHVEIEIPYSALDGLLKIEVNE